ARFAFSPALWRDDHAIIRRADRFLAAHPELDTFLYMTLGEKENPKMKGGYEAMVDLLGARAPRDLRWIAEYTPQGTHQTTPDLAIPSALAMLFAGSDK
ncbi:MAG: hypothetical protein KY432_12230, partial [Acidobacteria bacterium]|nr:hypothetical protein [Acidobacteriota bacterium]